ncbi:MAG: LacI family DNA-binding transcriptional regulator [Chloroflexi bacterium]|nr:LacI family DNA-binding transcriptional regulator [Chloroflexota bacterium]
MTDASSPGDPSRVTLARIAAAASVSVKTVSLALRGDPSVASKTAQRIQQLALQLGYAGRANRRQTIGVVVPYIGHRVYSELFAYLRQEAATFDFATLLGEGTGDPATEKALIGELRWRGVDGLILIAPRLSADEIDLESRAHQPIVTIGMSVSPGRTCGFNRIEIDHEAGGRLATEHLLAHGRRRIVYLAGRPLSASDQGRRRGYLAALEHATIGVDERLIVELQSHTVQPWPDYHVGFEQCTQLLTRGVAFDAILAYSDAIAIGAMRALADASRLRVPDDVSMIGFDGLAVGQYMVPRLTSVGIPWYRVALGALEALVDAMDNDVAPRNLRFAPELRPGETVAAAGKG